MATAQQTKSPRQRGTTTQAAKERKPSAGKRTGASARRSSTTRAAARPSTGTTIRTGEDTAARKVTTTARRPGTSRGGRRQMNGDRGAAVPIPVVTPHVTIYRVHVPGPGVQEMMEAGRSAASHLPPPERLAFYSGLGAAAVMGVISWPVAAAVGLGTVIARRARGRNGGGDGEITRIEQPEQAG